jgi:hypothetical protein
MGALRTTLIDTSRRSNLIASLLGGGRLDVGAAMHRVLAGMPWKTGADATNDGATLRLRTRATARAGSRVTLRWSATNADDVTSWRVSLDGRVVRTVAGTTAGVSRRIGRSGHHSWRVVGFAAGGVTVVAARRAFRALRRG